jgi:hypothetical protein
VIVGFERREAGSPCETEKFSDERFKQTNHERKMKPMRYLATCTGFALLLASGWALSTRPQVPSASASVLAKGLNNPRAWRAIGPAPPAIEAAIATHLPSHTIYIGSLGGGVLKSTDGGTTFAELNSGLDKLAVASLAMAPNDF